MLLLAALALAAADDPAGPGASFNPRANELVASDPIIQRWALERFDRNHDGWLTLYEAQPAAAAFRDLADSDRDGRVTVREYQAAVAFIRARY